MTGYAFVKFTRDQLAKVVPLSFIKDIEKENVSTTQYWVFWSHDDNMTPEEFLKENATIPKISNEVAAAETTDAGYYRATISVVTDTEAEMQETLAKKRARHASAKKLDGESFDASMLTVKKENKTKCHKEKAEEKELKSGGSRNNIRSLLEQNPEMRRAMKIQEKVAERTVNKSLQSKTSNSKQGQKNTGSRSSRRRRRDNSSNSSDDQSDNEVDSDLYPSPTKYMELKGKVQEQEFTIVRSLNDKLQDVLFAKEEEIRKLKAELSENSGNIGQRSAEIVVKSKEKKLPTHVKHKKPAEIEKLQCEETKAPFVSVADKSGEGDPYEQQQTALSNADCKSDEDCTNDDYLIAADVESRGPEKKGNSLTTTASSDKSPGTPPPTTDLSSAVAIKVGSSSSTNPNKRGNVDAASSSGPARTKLKKTGDQIVIKSEFKHLKDYEICPGNIIPAALMQYLFSKLPPGEKGDSRFVKTIPLRVWGSDYLASHTVAGRKGPKLVKKDPAKAQENMRGALDDARLFAVQDALKYRLEVEGIPQTESELHPRAKRSEVNSYIRDKIKTLRAGKFGSDNPEPHQKCEEEIDMENFLNQFETKPNSIVYA